jgi:hypothetical protein
MEGYLNKRNIEKISWFLGFTSVDFEKCTTDKLLKTYKETVAFIAEDIFRNDSNFSEVFEKDKKSFKEFINEYPVEIEIANKEKKSRLHEMKNNLIQIQHELNDVFKTFFSSIESVCAKKEAGWGPSMCSIDVTMRVQCGFIREEGTPSGYKIKNRTKVYVQEIMEGDWSKRIALVILRCLAGISLESFHRCPECNRFFINVTKKTKTYCTNKCATRFITRRKRREQKEAQSPQHQEENANGSTRARKAYENKIHKVNPKAKIERRPTKHKKE